MKINYHLIFCAFTHLLEVLLYVSYFNNLYYGDFSIFFFLIFIELKSSLMHMLSSVGDLHHLDFISTFISLKLLWFFSGVE